MEISIFKELTTNEHINQLIAESEKYTGLYVDMEDAEQRKYVKDKAYDIQQLLKKVDRKRIDASKEYKSKVEAEAADIKERLEIANLPFTLLIDEHKAERKKILDAEKARKQAILDAEQLELDHEMALLINKTFEIDRQQEIEAQKQRDDELAAIATERALEQERQRQEQIKQDEINAENARLANKQHCAEFNNKALGDIAKHCGLSLDQAKAVVTAIVKNQISNVTINY